MGLGSEHLEGVLEALEHRGEDTWDERQVLEKERRLVLELGEDDLRARRLQVLGEVSEGVGPGLVASTTVVGPVWPET